MALNAVAETKRLALVDSLLIPSRFLSHLQLRFLASGLLVFLFVDVGSSAVPPFFEQASRGTLITNGSIFREHARQERTECESMVIWPWES